MSQSEEEYLKKLLSNISKVKYDYKVLNKKSYSISENDILESLKNNNIIEYIEVRRNFRIDYRVKLESSANFNNKNQRIRFVISLKSHKILLAYICEENNNKINLDKYNNKLEIKRGI